MMRTIAHLMKLAICMLKHSSALPLSISCQSPLSFFFALLCLSPAPRTASLHQFLLFPVLRGSSLCHGTPEAAGGPVFSYLSDLYFGGLRGMQ